MGITNFLGKVADLAPDVLEEIFSGCNTLIENITNTITTMDSQNKTAKLNKLKLDYQKQIKSDELKSDFINSITSTGVSLIINGAEKVFNHIATIDKQDKDYKIDKLKLENDKEIQIKEIETKKEILISFLDFKKHVFDKNCENQNKKFELLQEHQKEINAFYNTALSKLQEDERKLNEEIILTKNNKKYVILSSRLSEISMRITNLSIQFEKFTLNYMILIQTLKLPEVQKNLNLIEESELQEIGLLEE